jgi:hypothetical protein
MPMEIDALKASPSVQAMHPSARAGYVWLLLDAWQSDDCTIPTDPIDLADKSGLGDELWAVYGTRILRKFERVDGSDRLRNLPQYERWQAAKAVYGKRQEAANRTNELRSPSLFNTITETEAQRSPSMENIPLPSFPLEPLSNPPSFTGTETETKEQQQKPSRAKRTNKKKDENNPDSCHTACKEIIFAYYKSKNQGKEPPWNGREGKALGMLLGADPAMNTQEMRRLLYNRYLSEVVHSERPGIWIGTIHNYANGPLDRYGKPLIRNGGNHAAVPNGTGDQIVGVLQKTLAGRQRDRALSENGDLSAGGEVGRNDTESVHGIPTPPRLASFSGGDEGSLDF